MLETVKGPSVLETIKGLAVLEAVIGLAVLEAVKGLAVDTGPHLPEGLSRTEHHQRTQAMLAMLC